MTKQIVLAALLGGLALFVWESIAHMALPLGEAGIKALPNETAVMATIKETVKESGFYFFPAPEDRPDMTSAEKQQAMSKNEERMRVGPAGIMIVSPNGRVFNMPALLGAQFGFDVLAMLIAAIVLAQMPAAAFGKKVAVVTSLGLLAWLRVDVPQWNWYSFPAVYTLAQGVTQVVGFFVAGLVAAKMVK